MGNNKVHFKLELEGDIDMGLVDTINAGVQGIVDVAAGLAVLSDAVDSGFDAVGAALTALKEQVAGNQALEEAVANAATALSDAQTSISGSAAKIQETIDKEVAAVA